MNQSTLEQFWQAMPSLMKLILGVVLGGTVHFLRNRAVPIVEGLAGAVTSMIAGSLFTVAGCSIKHLNMGEWWWLGAALTFMANYLLGGMETVGKQIRDTPIKMLIDTVLDIYDTVKARFKIEK